MNKGDEILDAAMDLLTEAGDISVLNMRKIAKRADCAHTNIYNYYKSFEALKWAMLERALDKLQGSMFEGRHVKTDVIGLISRYIDFALENPALYKLIWVSDLDPAAAPEDTAFLYRTPAEFSSISPGPETDILHSYVHGKLLNIIFNRVGADDRGKIKTQMLEVCGSMLS